MKAEQGVHESDLFQTDEAGKFAVRFPSGSKTVLSIQPNGDWETRPDTAVGAWEKCVRVNKNLLKFSPEGFAYFVVVG